MTLNNVHDFFEHKLQAMYATEKRLVGVLDEMASEARDPKLREALLSHKRETEEQARRLERVFQTLGRPAQEGNPRIVEAMREEKREFVGLDPIPEVLELFNIAAGIKTEHIEIAAYEGLVQLAEHLGAPDLAEPLRQNLQEERKALEKLTEISRAVEVPATKGKEKTAGTQPRR